MPRADAQLLCAKEGTTLQTLVDEGRALDDGSGVVHVGTEEAIARLKARVSERTMTEPVNRDQMIANLSAEEGAVTAELRQFLDDMLSEEVHAANSFSATGERSETLRRSALSLWIRRNQIRAAQTLAREETDLVAAKLRIERILSHVYSELAQRLTEVTRRRREPSTWSEFAEDLAKTFDETVHRVAQQLPNTAPVPVDALDKLAEKWAPSPITPEEAIARGVAQLEANARRTPRPTNRRPLGRCVESSTEPHLDEPSGYRTSVRVPFDVDPPRSWVGLLVADFPPGHWEVYMLAKVELELCTVCGRAAVPGVNHEHDGVMVTMEPGGELIGVVKSVERRGDETHAVIELGGGVVPFELGDPKFFRASLEGRLEAMRSQGLLRPVVRPAAGGTSSHVAVELSSEFEPKGTPGDPSDEGKSTYRVRSFSVNGGPDVVVDRCPVTGCVRVADHPPPHRDRKGHTWEGPARSG